MKITRLDAIRVIDTITNLHGAGFDDWWPDEMERIGLYDEEADDFPSIFDVFEALGVSKEECKKAGM